MGGDVVGGVDKHKTGEVAHGIQEISVAAVIGNLARSPKINMENVKRAAERPREDELAVASDSAVGSDAMRTLENPISNVLATEGPEEPKTNAMESLVNAHVTSGRGSVVSGKDVTAEGQRHNDKHQKLFVVLNGLEDNQFAIKKRQAVLADIIAASGTEDGEIGFGDW